MRSALGYNFRIDKDCWYEKTSMLWPSKNFLLYKSNILIKYFISTLLRLHATKAELRLLLVFQEKKNNIASY